MVEKGVEVAKRGEACLFLLDLVLISGDRGLTLFHDLSGASNTKNAPCTCEVGDEFFIIREGSFDIVLSHQDCIRLTVNRRSALLRPEQRFPFPSSLAPAWHA